MPSIQLLRRQLTVKKINMIRWLAFERHRFRYLASQDQIVKQILEIAIKASTFELSQQLNFLAKDAVICIWKPQELVLSNIDYSTLTGQCHHNMKSVEREYAERQKLARKLFKNRKIIIKDFSFGVITSLAQRRRSLESFVSQ